MVTIVVILLILGVMYWRMSQDSKGLKEAAKGRNAEQKQALRYFFNSGMFQKKVSDAQYDEMIQAKVKSTDFKKKALNKIGLDESEVQEVAPVNFEGYVFDNKKAYAKCGNDRKWRSSAYQISWLFFSSTQVYVYTYLLNMDEDGKKEATEEYFYKDITNFSTSSDTVEREIVEYKGCLGKESKERVNIDTNQFQLTVSGAKQYCAMEQNDTTERAVQGMKAKLREKKNA